MQVGHRGTTLDLIVPRKSLGFLLLQQRLSAPGSTSALLSLMREVAERVVTLNKIKQIVMLYFADFLDWLGVSDKQSMEPKDVGRVLATFCETVNSQRTEIAKVSYQRTTSLPSSNNKTPVGSSFIQELKRKQMEPKPKKEEFKVEKQEGNSMMEETEAADLDTLLTEFTMRSRERRTRKPARKFPTM